MSPYADFYIKGKTSVRILSEHYVKPSIPTPKHLQNYSLSFFDQLARQAHVPLIHFFPSSESTFKISKNSEHLQDSLSETLTHFYPLAGRLNEDGLSIDCQDQGVKYIQAKVNCNFNEFLHEAYENRDVLNDFIPWNIADESEVPLLGIQATFFQCGGLVLATYISHVPGDGYSAFNFVNQWAKMSRRLLFINFKEEENYRLNCNAGSLFPPIKKLSNILIPTTLKPPIAKLIQKNFLFNSEAISRLKGRVMKNAQKSRNENQLSRVVIITATIWKGLINAAKSRNGYLRPFVLSFSMSLRGKSALLDPSQDYLGNLYLLFPIRFDPAKSSTELHDLAFLIDDKLQKVSGDIAKATSNELVSMEIEFRNEVRDAGRNDEVDYCACTSWSRFPTFETDFGFGKPCRVVAAHGVPLEIFSLMDTKCGTGIEVQVSLNEIDMGVFQRDPDIVMISCVSKL